MWRQRRRLRRHGGEDEAEYESHHSSVRVLLVGCDERGRQPQKISARPQQKDDEGAACAIISARIPLITRICSIVFYLVLNGFGRCPFEKIADRQRAHINFIWNKLVDITS